MLELIPKQTVEKQVDKEVRSEQKYIASMVPQKGQSVFKYSVKDKKISVIGEADFEKQTVGLEGNVNKKLIIEKNHLYVVALNKKNAAKKFLKMYHNAITNLR